MMKRKGGKKEKGKGGGRKGGGKRERKGAYPSSTTCSGRCRCQEKKDSEEKREREGCHFSGPVRPARRQEGGKKEKRKEKGVIILSSVQIGVHHQLEEGGKKERKGRRGRGT